MNGTNGEMTPEKYKALVRQIAEKVWQMLHAELRVEKERRGDRDRRSQR